MKLILGTMTFGESVFAPEVSRFIEVFLGAGHTELDTAYVYNDGACERLLGDALAETDRPFRIATKVNPRISGRLDGEAALKQVNESLERLKLPAADIVYLHFPDPATPVEDVLAAMAELHGQGKFRELGLSNFPAWMTADAWRVMKEELKAINASVTVSQTEYDEITAIKPMFLICDYEDAPESVERAV